MKLHDNSTHKNFQGKETIQMGLDLNNTSSIMNLLRNNIYSDPISSIVREYYSNAIDAQVRINNSEPIEIDINLIDNKYVLSIRDFGGSMDKERIEDTYSKMGKSDKRNTNAEIGGWGLGCKSALSYTDHFYIETFTTENSINIYRKWVQFIDATKIGAISLLEEQTNFINFKQGTKISIGFDPKDYKKLIASLSLYLTYTKHNYSFLNKDVFKELKLGTKFYTHYGETWAIEFNQFSGTKEYLAIIEGIPYRLNTKLLFEFIKNVGSNLDYILNNNRPLYINKVQNKKRFYLFLSTLENFSFEIKLNTGTVDLSASREDLQYTDKTCTHLYAELYKMFIDFYKYLNMDVISNPDVFDAGRNFYKYPTCFANNFNKEIHWYKHKVYFNNNETMFKTNPTNECKIYKLDKTYSHKYQDYVNIVKNIDYYRMQITERKYVICLQNSKYSKYSKYVKYYLDKNTESTRRYTTLVLCIDPDDLICVKDWVIDACPIIKMSDLINTYNKECPVVKSEKLSSKLFKSLKLINDLERPRTEGLFQYTRQVSILKEPAYKCYFFDLAQFKNLETFTKVNKFNLYDSFKDNLFEYLKSKNLEGDIFICDKQTKNYNHENWVNIIDVILNDCKSFGISLENFQGSVVNELGINLFKHILIKNYYPIFSLYNINNFNVNSKYCFIQNLYNEANKNLKNNKLLYDLVLLVNIDMYQMQQYASKKHISKFENFGIPNYIKKECYEFFDLCKDYNRKLPFLEVYNSPRIIYDSNIELTTKNYTDYINIMEKELNLYITKNSEDFNKKPSEFSLLHNRLINPKV